MRTASVALVLCVCLVASCSDGDGDGDGDSDSSAAEAPSTTEATTESTTAMPSTTLDAAGFVSALQDAGLPIGDFVVWDEDTDPNSLLGRPGQYVGKATWVDDRSEPCLDEEPSWECGGDVEVFANDSARDARFEHLSAFATASLLGGYYMWKVDDAVVRVGYALTPSEAATYEAALRTNYSFVEALDSDSIPAASRELSDACNAASDDFVSYLTDLADAIDADPSALNDPDFAGDSFAVGERLGTECAASFDAAFESVLDRLIEQADTRGPVSRVFLEGTIAAVCADLEMGQDFPACGAGAEPGRTTMPPSTASPTSTTEAPSTTAEPPTSLTPSQQQAVRSARSYLEFMAFSRQGLIDQLSSEFGEGFPVGDATVAVDSLDVDWNEQAAKSAESYLEFSAFSCQGLIDQLASEFGEQFTTEQATYGAAQTGIC